MNFILNIVFRNYIENIIMIFSHINWNEFYYYSNIKSYKEYLNHINKLNQNNIVFCSYKLYSKYNKTVVVLKSLTKNINKLNILIK